MSRAGPGAQMLEDALVKKLDSLLPMKAIAAIVTIATSDRATAYSTTEAPSSARVKNRLAALRIPAISPSPRVEAGSIAGHAPGEEPFRPVPGLAPRPARRAAAPAWLDGGGDGAEHGADLVADQADGGYADDGDEGQ